MDEFARNTHECLTHAYIKDCIERFKAVHEPIARLLHLGLGIKLQYFDSLVMDEVLMRMVSEKNPALPVHDSVIAPPNTRIPYGK